MSFISPDFTIYGMHTGFLEAGQYGIFVIQLILYQLLHGSVFHILGNSLFIHIFGNVLEGRIGSRRYALFFLGNTLWVALCLLLLSSDANTIGASGFAMAILAYTGADMYTRRDPEYRAVGLFLVINILIGM